MRQAADDKTLSVSLAAVQGIAIGLAAVAILIAVMGFTMLVGARPLSALFGLPVYVQIYFVIALLHAVVACIKYPLLAACSIFLTGALVALGLILPTKWLRIAIAVFVAGWIVAGWIIGRAGDTLMEPELRLP